MVECKRLSGIGQDAERQSRLVTGPYGLADATACGHHVAVLARHTTAGRVVTRGALPGPVERCGSPGRPLSVRGRPGDSTVSPPAPTADRRHRVRAQRGATSAAHDGPAAPGRPAGDPVVPHGGAEQQRRLVTGSYGPTDARPPGTPGPYGRRTRHPAGPITATTRSGAKPAQPRYSTGHRPVSRPRACRRARTP